jgi:CYTH domain-containing protein
MKTAELELTYLARFLPDGLQDCQVKPMVDIYFPASSPHPVLRVRQRGDMFEITKKTVASGTDSSNMLEQTIPLTQEEFAGLTANSGKRVAKMRYEYPYLNYTVEIDVFAEALAGLVLVDFEFANRDEQLAFTMPDFSLAEVTQEAFIAGGMLAGKAYSDIAGQLAKFGYQPLLLTGR